MRLPSKQNLEGKKKKKKTFGVACTETERGSGQQERCRATRVAGICCRYFQAHRFAKTRPSIFLSSLRFEENLLEEPQQQQQETAQEAQEQQEQQGSLRFMARALM
jgi:hypothetical protein